MRRIRNTVIAVVIAGAAAAGGVALGQSTSSSSSSSQRQYDRSSDRSYDRSSRRSDRDRGSRSSYSSSSHYSSRGQYAASGSGMTGGSTTRPADFLEQYRLVLDRNIFSRNRVIYRESATTQPVVSSGAYFTQPALALTGLTKEDRSAGPVMAFIEDRRTGRTTGYKVGETIADSGQKITAINLDSIEYVGKDGRAVRVELGHALEGGPTYAVSSSYGGSATSPSTSGYSGGTPGGVSGGTSGSGSSGSGDTSDILEKLRQRRLQETKK